MYWGASRPVESLHPDEYVHVDAARYFEDRWLPPAPNADGLKYSSYGWSRVYSGEVAYIALGKAGSLAKKLGWPQERRLLFYRLLNATLGASLLAFLLSRRGRPASYLGMGLVLIASPQLIYTFSYFNTDGWSLAVCILLLLKSIDIVHRRRVTRADLLALLLLSTLVGLARLTSIVALFPAWGILMLFVLEQRLASRKNPRLISLLLVLLASLSMAAAWRYGPSQFEEGYSEKIDQMREERSLEGYKPSNPSSMTYLPAQKPYRYERNLGKWFLFTSESTYGRFGRFRAWPTAGTPERLQAIRYVFAGLGFLALMALLWRRREAPLWLKALCLLAPLTLASAYAGMLTHSLLYDWQPQGRYLFGALPAMAVLFTTPLRWWPQKARYAMGAVAVLLIAHSAYYYVDAINVLLTNPWYR